MFKIAKKLKKLIFPEKECCLNFRVLLCKHFLNSCLKTTSILKFFCYKYLHILDDILLSIITKAGYLLYPLPLRWVSLFCFGLINLTGIMFFHLLYKGLIAMRQVHLGLLGLWVYFSYAIILSRIESLLIVQTMTMTLYDLHERGDRFYMNISKAAANAKRITNILMAINALVGVTLLPLFGDEEMSYFTVYYFHHYFPSWLSWICEALFYMNVIHIMYTFVAQGLFLLYCTLEIIFQMYLLNDMIKDVVEHNLGYPTSFSLLQNNRYQNDITSNLKKCVKLHVIIKKFRKDVNEMTFPLVIIDTYFGIANSGLILFFLLSDLNFYTTGRLLFILVLTASFVIILSFYGQQVSNEGEKWNYLLSRCPWHLWNKSNRNMLRFIILNSKELPTIGAPPLLILNYSSCLMNLRKVYSIAAFLVTARKGIK